MLLLKMLKKSAIKKNREWKNRAQVKPRQVGTAGGRNEVNHIAICSKSHVRLAPKQGILQLSCLRSLTWARHCNSGREAERSQQQEDKST
jgi:hypothetical protein